MADEQAPVQQSVPDHRVATTADLAGLEARIAKLEAKRAPAKKASTKAKGGKS